MALSGMIRQPDARIVARVEPSVTSPLPRVGRSRSRSPLALKGPDRDYGVLGSRSGTKKPVSKPVGADFGIRLRDVPGPVRARGAVGRDCFRATHFERPGRISGIEVTAGLTLVDLIRSGRGRSIVSIGSRRPEVMMVWISHWVGPGASARALPDSSFGAEGAGHGGDEMVRPAGFEPATDRLEVCCSIR